MAAGNASLLTAIRGPIMLITLGALFAWDQLGGQPFTRTFPVLLIVYGFLKLAEHLTGEAHPHYGGQT